MGDENLIPAAAEADADYRRIRSFWIGSGQSDARNGVAPRFMRDCATGAHRWSGPGRYTDRYTPSQDGTIEEAARAYVDGYGPGATENA